MSSYKHGALVLEDACFFTGELVSHISHKDKIGEVVFNTAMSGYQEIITDPSYKGQLVCFTYPSIGNYGINALDNESDKIHLSGIIVKEICHKPSNYRSEMSLSNFLDQNEVPAIAGIDTRSLVRHIREKGSIQAGIFYSQDTGLSKAETTHTQWLQGCLEKIKNSVHITEKNLTLEFNGKQTNQYVQNYIQQHNINTQGWLRIGVLDFGIKYSILKNLIMNKMYPVVFAGNGIIQNHASKLTACDGFLLSNGPGDPNTVQDGIKNIQYLIEQKKPILAICLGHQLLACTLGMKIMKMKFGHHAANHPVSSLELAQLHTHNSNKHASEIRHDIHKHVKITSQNHNFAIDKRSTLNLPYVFKSMEENMNDNSVAGFRIQENNLDIISVQYHPEAGPGPNDAGGIFLEFYDRVYQYRNIKV